MPTHLQNAHVGPSPTPTADPPKAVSAPVGRTSCRQQQQTAAQMSSACRENGRPPLGKQRFNTLRLTVSTAVGGPRRLVQDPKRSPAATPSTLCKVRPLAISRSRDTHSGALQAKPASRLSEQWLAPDHRQRNGTRRARTTEIATQESAAQRLPAEVIAHILGFLVNAADVCSASQACWRWYEGALDARAWRSARVLVRNPAWLSVGTGPGAFIEYGEDLRAFGYSFVAEKTLAAIRAKRIQHVMLVGPNIHCDAIHLAQFADEVSPRLRTLSLYAVPLVPSAWMALCDGLPSLHRLELYHATLKECTLGSVLRRLPELRELILVKCGATRRFVEAMKRIRPTLHVTRRERCDICESRALRHQQLSIKAQFPPLSDGCRRSHSSGPT